jgi:hypothetical protein
MLALVVAALLTLPAVAGARPAADHARVSLDQVTVVRLSDGAPVRVVHRGQSALYRAQYTVRGGSGTGRLVMRLRNPHWLFTISSKAQHLHPGVWRFAARAAVPVRFPAGDYTLTTTVSLRRGAKTVATAVARRALRVA